MEGPERRCATGLVTRSVSHKSFLLQSGMVRVYSQLLFGNLRAHQQSHSYFDGEADWTREIRANGVEYGHCVPPGRMNPRFVVLAGMKVILRRCFLALPKRAHIPLRVEGRSVDDRSIPDVSVTVGIRGDIPGASLRKQAVP